MHSHNSQTQAGSGYLTPRQFPPGNRDWPTTILCAYYPRADRPEPCGLLVGLSFPPSRSVTPTARTHAAQKRQFGSTVTHGQNIQDQRHNGGFARYWQIAVTALRGGLPNACANLFQPVLPAGRWARLVMQCVPRTEEPRK